MHFIIIWSICKHKGYLSIAQSEQDKRAADVTITSEGEKAFKTCSERAEIFLADIFHEFSSDELETFCALLKKLYHFDGAGQAGFYENMSHHEGDENIIMQHHQNYAKKRGNREK